MKLKNKFLYIVLGSSIIFTSCEKLLDRPVLDEVEDKTGLFWRNEADVRLFASGFYPQYFNGYNSSWTADYTPVRGYVLTDDITTSEGQQRSFENSAPPDRASVSEASAWLAEYAGPTWNFAWVRKSNIFLARLESEAKPSLSTEQYSHWLAVGRFFKGYEYARLTSVFGDVPYFETQVSDTDFATQYKDRDDRGYVMDKVYDDFVFVLDNIRANDGTNVLDKNVAAAFISRLMLFEGSWQKYHGLDQDRAKKYLQLAERAAKIVMDSGKYAFTSDFKSLFTSLSISNNKEVIMYRVYDNTLTVTHAVASEQQGTVAQATAPNLNLVKDFVLIDGKPVSASTLPGANDYSLANLAKTRDSRFEASFATDMNARSSSLIYGNKFVSRAAYNIPSTDSNFPAWSSNTNISDAPVVRYAEVVLNWLEAKQILAESFGGAAVTQLDLDQSINAIRKRPLDAIAITKGVSQTAPLMIGVIANDPSRDSDVSPLMWEIRRERRMEFVFEFSRLQDLRRWKKLYKMDFATNSDYFLGSWVNLKTQAPSILEDRKNINITAVRKVDGSIVVYNGTNADDMIGFYVIPNAKNRNKIEDKNYLAPVGLAQIADYESRGYKLTQTKGW